MNFRSLKVGFEGVGPGRSAELVASLNTWLNETVVLPASGENGVGPVEVEVEQDNSQAQGVGTLLILSFAYVATGLSAPPVVEGMTAGLVHVVIESLLRWWVSNGEPPMRIEESETGSRHVITSDTAEPEKVLTSTFQPGEEPGGVSGA